MNKQTERFFGNGFWGIAPLPELTQDEIRTMPMLYRADADFAQEKCPTLKPFLDTYHDYAPNKIGWKYESIDVKVTMLKPGWWPCIPGWHLDDFYRPTGDQPDLIGLENNGSTHLMAVYGDASMTEFVSPKISLPLPPQGETVYGFYDKAINNLKPRTVLVEPNYMYRFDCFNFHRGMPATKAGWRAFVRLTLSNHRQPKNEIRSQVQVYVPKDELFKGW